MKVYIISCKGNFDRIKYLFSRFKDIDIVEDTNDINSLLRKEENHHSKDSTIIVRQSTTSLAHPDKIYEIIKEANANKDKFDVFYLTAWNDACQKRRTFIKEHNLYYTYEPNGSQAIMFTPRGRRRVLGDEDMENKEKLHGCMHQAVAKEQLVAITCFPNLFYFDPEAAINNNEFLYLNECRQVKNTADSATTTAYIWFIIAFVLILIVGYAFFFGRGRYY